jgi:uncharacterized repeat protein (TIGR03803 family)
VCLGVRSHDRPDFSDESDRHCVIASARTPPRLARHQRRERGLFGSDRCDTVFEIAKTAHGYASTPITLVSFDGTNGGQPIGGLIADAHGDLFGTTQVDGANGQGTVFEIAKTAHGYASTPTTLVGFDGTNGAQPIGGLIADAHGDLFGTTLSGGAHDRGTVFEIAKTAHGYASTPTILVSFNGANGAGPHAGLIAGSHRSKTGPLYGCLGGRRGRPDWLRLHRDGSIHDSVLHALEQELDLEEMSARRHLGAS